MEPDGTRRAVAGYVSRTESLLGFFHDPDPSASLSGSSRIWRRFLSSVMRATRGQPALRHSAATGPPHRLRQGAGYEYRGDMVSAVRRLLDELSWEGNARKYRDGGLGLENVLTAEVFQALDFLPRQAFLAPVLAGASGASLQQVPADIERASVDILPGDLTHPELTVRAQPDVCIDLPSTFVFVEAKRLRASSFQPAQLAKELILTAAHARGRRPVLLLVLAAPPPVLVKGHGPQDIEDAVRLGQAMISASHGRLVEVPDPRETVAWTTWADIGAQVAAALQAYDNPDSSTYNAVARVVMTLSDALKAHA